MRSDDGAGAPLVAVDDDAHILSLLQIAHRRTGSGRPLCVFTDPLQAVESIVQSHVHLLLVDIHMVPIDGFELVARVRAAKPDVPVAFLTTSEHPADRRQAADLANARYYLKPLGLAGWVDLVRELA